VAHDFTCRTAAIYLQLRDNRTQVQTFLETQGTEQLLRVEEPSCKPFGVKRQSRKDYATFLRFAGWPNVAPARISEMCAPHRSSASLRSARN
jgi:hypothetical protein